nr:MAG TPA: Potassium voltage-gated channel subfamily E, Membrane protein, Ion channel [Caudoviricetes sp.]
MGKQKQCCYTRQMGNNLIYLLLTVIQYQLFIGGIIPTYS